MQKTRQVGLLVSVVICILVVIGLVRNRPARPSAEDQPASVEATAHANSSVNLKTWVENGGQDLARGVELAKARGTLMRELIQRDPERAIQESLSLAEWNALPPELRPYVEQPFSVVADVEVMIACGPDVSETSIQTTLPNGNRLKTYVYGRRSGLSTKHGVPVQGIQIDGLGALRPEIFQRLDAADETVALGLYPVALSDPGGDSVATLAGGRIFYFKDRAAIAEANTRIAALEELPGPDSGAQQLFAPLDALVVDGKIDFATLEAKAYAVAAEWAGSARDMIVIMVDFSDIPGAPADPVSFSNSLNSTVAQQISEMSYEKTYIVATVNTNTYRMPQPSTVYTNNSTLLFNNATSLVAGVDFSLYETVCVLFPDTPGIWWAGLASINGRRLWLNGNTSTRVVTHELGHNYGSSHASSWEVPGGNPVDPTGSYTEYGDFSDIMGSASLPEGHFNCWHKKNIGWLDATNWQAVATSGTYRVYRSDDYRTTGAVRGLEIDKGGGDAYWVGLRQEFPEYETFSRGTYVLWKKSGDNRSYLLDMTPQSADGGYDGGLALGQTYSDASAGVHITPVARGGQTSNAWMDITVNLGSFPGNTPPTASLSGPSSLGVQESALFSVSASDIDGDELAYYWDIGDGLVKPNTPSIPVAWLSGSTVTVSCVVSDMKGGTTMVSQSVALSNPLDNWTQRTSGVTANLNDICVGGGRLVAVGDQGNTAYSDDGTNWTAHTSANVWLGNVYLEGIAYDGAQFIAVGMDNGGGWEMVTFSSPDGTYWTKRYDSNSGSGSNVRFNDVAIGGGVYIAVGDNGAIIRSTDGISWSPVSSGTTTNLSGVSYGEGTFVAVGAASGGGPAIVFTSADGTSWTDHSSGVDLESWRGFYDVEYLKDRFLASGWHARILHSLDQGQTFTTSMTGNGLIIPAFAYGNGIFFAAGLEKVYSGAWYTYDINLISLDGANWTTLSTASQNDRNAAVFYNGTFITVGDGGAIWQSDPAGSLSDGYAVWQYSNADALGFDRDPYDDADFDGFWNLWEYAMGSLATDAGSVPASAVLGESGGYFTVSYARDGIAPDVDYAVQRASDLVANDFSAANAVVTEDSDTNLTARSVFPMSSQTNEFMRLNLDLQ